MRAASWRSREALVPVAEVGVVGHVEGVDLEL
jgi:hypothetical protein